jgi:hypothetical protein
MIIYGDSYESTRSILQDLTFDTVKAEFSGSIFKQLHQTYEYLMLNNRTVLYKQSPIPILPFRFSFIRSTMNSQEYASLDIMLSCCSYKVI